MKRPLELVSCGTVAVTGASRGIGKAIALYLAGKGYTVICLTRGGIGPEGSDVSDALRDRLIPLTCDVADEKSVAAAFAEIAEMVDRLDGLINNAGIHIQGPASHFSAVEFDHVMHTNATSVYMVSQAALPLLTASGEGIIVNIGSFFDRLGIKQNSAYCASKAAVAAITRCLAVEWGHRGISVVNVAPGYVRTDVNSDYLDHEDVAQAMGENIPAGRPGTPGEVARLVTALVDQRISFLTGTTIYIDGGHGIAL